MKFVMARRSVGLVNHIFALVSLDFDIHLLSCLKAYILAVFVLLTFHILLSSKDVKVKFI